MTQKQPNPVARPLASKDTGIPVSLPQLARAFEAWENGFRAGPAAFMTKKEEAREGVSELSASRAAYLYDLLRGQ